MGKCRTCGEEAESLVVERATKRHATLSLDSKGAAVYTADGHPYESVSFMCPNHHCTEEICYEESKALEFLREESDAG